jgi:methionine-rich copper-binding protein CopC
MSTFNRILGITAIVTVAAAGQALAHAHLQSAIPAMNGTVKESPSELDLSFSEGLNVKFTGLTLTGSDKKPVSTGDAKLGAKDDKMLIVPLSAKLSAGTYTVEWHALSTDGHKTNGTYSFTVKP